MHSLIKAMSEFLPFLLWAGMWAVGGWLICARVFILKPREQLIVGIGAGLVSSGWLANLLARIIPLPYASWLSAAVVLALGSVLAWPLLRKRAAGRLSISWGQLLLVGVITIGFTAIGRGLAIFDDYQLVPTVSLMAAGDVPPHYSMNPALRFDYHYFLLLFAAQAMRLGQMYPWNALDLARGLALALTLTLGALWTWRLTRNRLAGAVALLFLAFSSGARWLLLFLPPSLGQKIADHITLVGSGAESGPNLSAALSLPWHIEGTGPMPFPFAYANGINLPMVMMHAGRGTMNLLILLLLLFTFNRWKHRAGIVLTAIFFASLALADEVAFALLCLGLVLVFLVSAIRRKSLRLAPALGTSLILVAVAGLAAILQGGVLTSIAFGLFERITQGGETTLFSYPFQISWPPAFVSTHLGILKISDPVTLLVGLLEAGAVVCVLPLVILWGLKMLRMRRWFQAGLAGMATVSVFMLFVRYTGDAGVTSSARLMEGLLNVCKIYAIPLVWIVARKFGERAKAALFAWGVLAVFGGMAIFSVELIAIQKPVTTFFIKTLDVQMERDYWNKLAPGALVFDPDPNRAPTVFGRFTNAASAWYVMTPKWQALLESPDPYKIRAAGFGYVYYDIRYWENLSPQSQTLLESPCAILVQEYTGYRSETDYRPDFRRLLDVRNCK